ncbi:pyridoxal phosphate-dependent aminotransferase [Halonatronum saccharophilum]|uniref:pyridoxal phosphate-dependent aminotransferase n=1 Tax=Halonatronum saccharophilum TaxID=150060 RepID=UPI000485BC4F|nr:pyridoxal phosphate-dependent aminotransferase [Halonatronum saccharophilum]
MRLAAKVEKIDTSPTLAITARANALKAEGEDIISLGAGEPDFSTPTHVKEAAIKAIEEGFTNYTATVGIKDLREAICDSIKEDRGVEYSSDQVIVSSGAKNSLFNAILALVEEGDEVILPAPYWVSYTEQIKFAGGRPVVVDTLEENGFKLTVEELKQAITPKTKVLILNSPNNPTGSVYTKGELEKIAQVIIEEDLFVISDEIYRKISYEAKATSIVSLGEEIKKRTVIIDGVSKAYAMTGWRIGYGVGPTKVIEAMARLQSHSTSNANSVAQKASLAAIAGTQKPTEEMLKAFDKRRDIITDVINDIEGMKANKPKGAFYLFVNIKDLLGMTVKGRKVEDDLTLAELILEEVGVAVVPGTAFGKEGYIRLSYATSEEDIKEAISRIKGFVELYS